MSETIVLRGRYDRRVYIDMGSGLCIFRIDVKYCSSKDVVLNNGKATCTGYIPAYIKGMPLELTGRLSVTQNYGQRIECIAVKEYEDNAEVMSDLLKSMVPGIGSQEAEEIVEVCGTEGVFAFCRKDNAIQLLSSAIQWMDKDMAAKVVKTVRNAINEREMIAFLRSYGGKASSAIRVIEKYGTNAKARLCSNPYVVGMTCRLPFEVCDKIAFDHGNMNTAQRMKMLAMQSVEHFTGSGNCFAVLEDVVKCAQKICNGSASPVFNEQEFIVWGITRNKDLKVEQNGQYKYIYTNEMYAFEEKAARELKRINTGKKYPFNPEWVVEMERQLGFTYAPAQREATNALRSAGLKILTGGPGTGKTTTVKLIISLYQKMFPGNTIKLCAPTGRAAQRMAESTGMEAVTIHRLMDYHPVEGGIACKSGLDPIDADFIVIDEVSMLDIEIFSYFLAAVRTGTLILMVGDTDQLASVGPGDVLADLIQSNKVAGIGVFRLSAVYRQGAGSPIIINASKINSGQKDLVQTDDYAIERVDDDKEQFDLIKGLVDKYYDPNQPYYFQVLTTAHKGAAGITELNKKLQQYINPNFTDKKVKKFSYNGTRYCKGDKIILMQNNYKIGYYNGDVGTVAEVSDNGVTVELDGNRKIVLDKDMVADLSLAYAMSIHKSQGSEFPVTVVCLPSDPRTMLKRNLLYTGVTRGKKKVITISTRDAQEIAINCTEKGKRRTMLPARIAEVY